MGSILGTLVVRVVLVGHSQPNMLRRGQGRLVFESRVWPFRPFWSTLRTVLRSTLVPKLPRGSFPSATTYPEPGPITPSTAIRPRVVSLQVLKVANSRFVQLSVMPPRSRLFKSGGPRDRCNTNLGPNLRPVNSKAANFLYKCAQNCQKGVMCVRAESTIRVKAL